MSNLCSDMTMCMSRNNWFVAAVPGVLLIDCVVFFFSSRRRHTRFDCDWSSDVCSSDLAYYWLVEPGTSTTSLVEAQVYPSLRWPELGILDFGSPQLGLLARVFMAQNW